MFERASIEEWLPAVNAALIVVSGSFLMSGTRSFATRRSTVASRQVEDALYAHDAVADAAVIGLPDEKWIEAVTAVVVARDDVTEEELIAHVRERLPAFKAPKRVFFVDGLPRNASGKVLKRELRERFGPVPASGPLPGAAGPRSA